MSESESPVRIAGVEVGSVTGVERLSDGDNAINADSSAEPETGTTPPASVSVVTMKINEDGLPLKEDATFKLRPRLFLEGNLFVDVKSGSRAPRRSRRATHSAWGRHRTPSSSIRY